MLRYYLKPLLFVAVVVFGVVLVWEPWREYQNTRAALLELDRELLAAQEENDALRHEIHRLRTDSRAIERVAREKFGCCRPREIIYDFSAGETHASE